MKLIIRIIEENSNITFRNPSADRYQMILEYYEAYHDYNFAKIELINCYMEAYENTVRIPKAKEISQILTDMINAKPMMNFEVRITKSFLNYQLG